MHGVAPASVVDYELSLTEYSGKCVALHCETLLNGLREAVKKFIRAANSDEVLRANLEETVSR